MAGISPRNVGVSPARAGAVSASALTAVEARISVELGRERAEGWPLKAAYERVAHRLGITARRVRAFHHHEVPAAAVTADELLRVDAAYRADFAVVIERIEAIRGIVGAVESGDPLRGLALSTMAGTGAAERVGQREGDAQGVALGRAVAPAAAPGGRQGADQGGA